MRPHESCCMGHVLHLLRFLLRLVCFSLIAFLCCRCCRCDFLLDLVHCCPRSTHPTIDHHDQALPPRTHAAGHSQVIRPVYLEHFVRPPRRRRPTLDIDRLRRNMKNS